MKSTNPSFTTLSWFRRDLRLRDNPAFHHAVSQGAVIAIYTLCESQWNIHGLSLAQRAFIVSQLKVLEKSLAKKGIPLVILNTETFSATPDAILAFAKNKNVQQLVFNEEYEINEVTLTKNVKSLAQKQGIKTQSFHDQCLIQPGKILNKQGIPYKVFTAFKKAYLAELVTQMRPIYALPKAHRNQKNVHTQSNVLALGHVAVGDIHVEHMVKDEIQAHDHLNEFCSDRIADYKNDRDFPSINGTSQLSACLAIGLLSARQCFQAAQSMSTSNYLDNEGVSTWVSELIWRDFYRHLIYLFPDLCKHKPFKAKTDQLPWKHDLALFTAWKEGKTGYPLVDAAMRQLNQTGWMHNRLRMVVAMFLTKHLFIDWRWGEAYFMETLIDADLASNNGGWQWSASTGVDAVPYFRIFNPTRQSERFDHLGVFIRQYVPELASLDNKSIHKPTTKQVEQVGYVLPVVDHAFSVKQTKSWFKSLDGNVENQKSL